MHTQPKHCGACAFCPILSTSVTVGKLYSQFNKKLLEFLIARYIAYCDNFTAQLWSVRPRQQVARTGDTSVSRCQFAGPCRQWQELVQSGVSDRHRQFYLYEVSPSSARLSFWNWRQDKLLRSVRYWVCLRWNNSSGNGRNFGIKFGKAHCERLC